MIAAVMFSLFLLCGMLPYTVQQADYERERSSAAAEALDDLYFPITRGIVIMPEEISDGATSNHSSYSRLWGRPNLDSGRGSLFLLP
jgi:hypothetical protein